jgi:signal transduction histidine kinase
MRVAVDHESHRVAADWLLESARSQKWIYLERLALDGALNRRVVQQRHEVRRPEPRKRRLELQRLVHRLAHKLLDDRFAPRSKRSLTEPAAKAFRTRDADALQLAGVAVEHGDTRVRENLPDLPVFPRFDVVVAEDRGHWNPQRAQLARENLRFVRQAVVGEVASHQQHVSRLADPREERLKAALGGLGAVEVANCGDAHDAISHEAKLFKTHANILQLRWRLRRLPCSRSIVSDHMRPRLGELVVTPLATIGVLSALLVWEIEHVGSVILALVLALVGLTVGVFVARGVRRQIDELSRYYERLLETADEESRRAESANQMKDEFLATLSHELRTPLNSVLGWARLLASGKLDSEHYTKAVQAIERAGWAQSRLIEDLLDVSRIVSGKLQILPRPLVAQPLVESAVQSLRPAADAKHITIDLSLNPAIGPIEADPDRLQQVIWNLISNAIKFTPVDGHVDVALDADDSRLWFVVRDTGIGFSPNVADHLFERFRQGDSSTTRQYGGLGLGLGLVRHIVEMHGGTVTAESAGANRGSTFMVTLPLRAAHAYAAEPAATEPAPILRGIKVLVVDDDLLALDFIRTTLEQYGASVVTASSAREARERFAKQPPDVLVSDLLMPGEDGLDLIRKIRELEEPTGHHVPAAALTALARSDDRRRALNAGYQMHVAKPIDPLELASAVEQLVHH